MSFGYKCTKCNLCVSACPQEALTSTSEGIAIDRAICDKCSKCSEICPAGALITVGEEITVEELLGEVDRDVLLYDTSGGGVTFSGGEPLAQPVFLKEALKRCKANEIHTAIETSGYTTKEVWASIIKEVNLFLYDLKLIDDDEHQEYCGVSNRSILNNLEGLVEEGRGRDVIIRFPLIPGITDTERNISALVDFLRNLRGISEIDLLPYHDVGEKYARLGVEWKMKAQAAPSESTVGHIKERLEGIGMLVRVGG
jgi:pyruvate formate lyase activating enzyme